MTSVPSTLPRPRPATRRRRRVGVAATSVVAISTFGLLAGLTGTAQAATAVPLGAAKSFAVLAGAGITNTGATSVRGDIGSFATTSIDGGITLTGGGTNHGGDEVTQAAKTALSDALVTAAGAGPATPVAAGELSGLLLPAGVYSSGSTLGLTGVLTLDGGGSYDSVFVFQAGSALTTASNSRVLLTNGAQACNVFWQLGSSATLGSDSTLVGTVLADTAIDLGTRAEVQGRVLASTAAVTLRANVITRPDTCRTGTVVPVVVPPTTSAPAPTTSPATTAAPTGTSSSTPGATSASTPGATSATRPSTPSSAPSSALSSATPPGTSASSGSSSTTASSAPRAAGGGNGTGSSTQGTTYGQVDRVPVGAVDTGDGSAAGRAGSTR